MSNTLDTRGLSCPQPVIMVHQAFQNNPHSLEVLVDNEASRENVTRAAQNKGWGVTEQEEKDYVRLVLVKG